MRVKILLRRSVARLLSFGLVLTHVLQTERPAVLMGFESSFTVVSQSPSFPVFFVCSSFFLLCNKV